MFLYNSAYSEKSDFSNTPAYAVNSDLEGCLEIHPENKNLTALHNNWIEIAYKEKQEQDFKYAAKGWDSYLNQPKAAVKLRQLQ